MVHLGERNWHCNLYPFLKLLLLKSNEERTAEKQKQIFINKNPKCDTFCFELKGQILYKHRITDSIDELSSKKLLVLANMEIFSFHIPQSAVFST